MSRKCHADKVRDLFGKIPSILLSEWSRRMDCCNKIACSFRKLFRYNRSNSSHDFWRTKNVTQMSRREGWYMSSTTKSVTPAQKFPIRRYYPVFRRTLRNRKVTAVQTRVQTSSESCMPCGRIFKEQSHFRGATGFFS